MKKPIRVLHVLGGLGLGGAESRIMDLYRQMDREEVQFDFLVHSKALKNAKADMSAKEKQYYDEEVLAMGGHIYALPKFKVYNYWDYRRAIKRFFSEHHDFRVVQGHMTSTAGIYLPIAKKAGIPVTVAHSRNAGVEKGLKGLATRFFRRKLAGKADVCFACSTLAGEDVFGRQVVADGKVKIIHNAIDAGRFRFDPEKRGAMRKKLSVEDKLVLGHVGRFDYQKNHPYLLRVFYELCRMREDAVLILLGEGAHMEEIKALAADYGIENKVRFMGNQRETQDYYMAFDVFLLPSFYEGLPGVLVEAQAAGLRCFVSDTITTEARATELISYRSITEEPVEWARAILEAIPYERRDMLQMMQKNGFDVASQARGYTHFYQTGDSSLL